MRKCLSGEKKSELFRMMLRTLKAPANLGFSLKSHNYFPSNGPAGERYEFVLKGDSDVSVELTFYPSSKGDDYVVVYIVDKEGERDFSLDDWTQSIGPATDRSPFNLSNYKGSYQQRLECFFDFINSLFNSDELRVVLEGNYWPEVEFNWGKLK